MTTYNVYPRYDAKGEECTGYMLHDGTRCVHIFYTKEAAEMVADKLNAEELFKILGNSQKPLVL